MWRREIGRNWCGWRRQEGYKGVAEADAAPSIPTSSVILTRQAIRGR